MAKDIVIKVSIDTSFVKNHLTRALFAAFSGKIFNDVITLQLIKLIASY